MHRLVDAVGGVDITSGDRDVLVAVAGASALVRRWLDGLDVRVARAMAEFEPRTEVILAEASRTSPREVGRVLQRATTTGTVSALGAALDAGDVSAGHVDVVTSVLRQVEPDVRAVLVANGAWVARRAAVLSPVELRRELNAEVRALEADGGTARLERQRRAARLHTWVDPDGMWRFDGRFDPETGLRLHTRLLSATQQLFAEQTPADAPDDPVERQAFLRARAWIAMLDSTTCPASASTATGTGSGTRTSAGTGTTPSDTPWTGTRTGVATGTGPPELIVVVDTTAPDPHGLPSIDWGLPVELPLDVVHRCFDEGHVSCIIVRHGVIIHAPGQLDLGRTTRLANRAQRRALRALYPTCAIPGCDTRYELCKLHHVIWWEHGGCTNLDNLLPLCVRHHHAVHDTGWHLKLTPDRQLTITYPDTTTHTTGPPRRSRPRPPTAEPAAPTMSVGADPLPLLFPGVEVGDLRGRATRAGLEVVAGVVGDWQQGDLADGVGDAEQVGGLVLVLEVQRGPGRAEAP